MCDQLPPSLTGSFHGSTHWALLCAGPYCVPGPEQSVNEFHTHGAGSHRTCSLMRCMLTTKRGRMLTWSLCQNSKDLSVLQSRETRSRPHTPCPDCGRDEGPTKEPLGTQDPIWGWR